MPKVIAETVGDFMLLDMSGNEVPHNRPAVVPNGQFVQQQVVIGQLRVLAVDIVDEATDAEWAQWLKDAEGDVALAVESFSSRFGISAKVEEAAPETVSEKKGRRTSGA